MEKLIYGIFGILSVFCLYYCKAEAMDFGTRNSKKQYQCKKIDFYKNVKIDYKPHGKCAEVSKFPDDFPLEVNHNRDAAKKYFADKNFPGKISPSVKWETIELKLSYPLPLWVFSTGAYAAPNEEITLEVPEELIKYNLQIQIGVHSDNVSHIKDALRDGVVVVKKKIENKITRIKNRRGGPVLIETRFIDKNTKEEVSYWHLDKAVREKTLLNENYSITLKNVIRAPKFVLGKTSPQEWVDEERCNPAPWAELEGKYITISVPSNVIRNLNNPEAVMNFWDAGVRSIQSLSGWEDLIHLIKERFVTDIDISIGFMHSGYPVMSTLQSALYVVDQEPRDKSKPWSPENSELQLDYTLGHFHELAHNRQTADPWITAELGEWSTNIFVMKANCELKGYEPEEIFTKYGDHPKMEALRFFNGDESVYNKDLRKKWKNTYAAVAHTKIPNLFYIHLYKVFGFDIYKKIITHYQNIKQEEWDKNGSCKNKNSIECNNNRLNSFALEFSKITGSDMTDYLNIWGYELTWGREEIQKLNLPKFSYPPILTDYTIGSSEIKEGIFYDFTNLKTNEKSFSINISGRAVHDGASVISWGREFCRKYFVPSEKIRDGRFYLSNHRKRFREMPRIGQG
ncbi:MAG: M60 family metallopeptidase [Leptospiraceae bacterium]|nr:hypothetical protein [Leptospiraceae bacterium]MCK6381321.1 M60 family metallopeptidase [Leptospiraceae bacterium]